MKINASALLLTCLGSVAVILAGCNQGEAAAASINSKAAAKEVADEIKTGAVDSWKAIKDYSYDKRLEFAAGLDRLATQRDAELTVMNKQLNEQAALPEATAMKREKAVADYRAARDALTPLLDQLRDSTAEGWDNTKARATDAMQDLETAFHQIQSSSVS